MKYKFEFNQVSEGTLGPYIYSVFGTEGIDWLYLSEYPEPVIRMWN